MGNFKYIVLLLVIFHSCSNQKAVRIAKISDIKLSSEFKLVNNNKYYANGEINDDRDSIYSFEALNRTIDIKKRYFTKEITNDISIDEKKEFYRDLVQRRISILLNESDKNKIISSKFDENGFYLWYTFKNNYDGEDSVRNINKLLIEHVSSKLYLIQLEYTSFNLSEKDSKEEIEKIYKQFGHESY